MRVCSWPSGLVGGNSSHRFLNSEQIHHVQSKEIHCSLPSDELSNEIDAVGVVMARRVRSLRADPQGRVCTASIRQTHIGPIDDLE